MIIRVETQVFVIRLDKEIFHPRLGDRWKNDLRNIGGEPIDGIENDNTIRVTFEDDLSSDAEIETELRIITDHWKANGWIIASTESRPVK